MKFDKEIQKILEGFNVYPRAKVPMASKNMDFSGPMPTGFKGSVTSGGQNSTIAIKWPKKKKKKKIKKKKRFSS